MRHHIRMGAFYGNAEVIDALLARGPTQNGGACRQEADEEKRRYDYPDAKTQKREQQCAKHSVRSPAVNCVVASLRSRVLQSLRHVSKFPGGALTVGDEWASEFLHPETSFRGVLPRSTLANV
jgi:hypothetical protein